MDQTNTPNLPDESNQTETVDTEIPEITEQRETSNNGNDVVESESLKKRKRLKKNKLVEEEAELSSSVDEDNDEELDQIDDPTIRDFVVEDDIEEAEEQTDPTKEGERKKKKDKKRKKSFKLELDEDDLALIQEATGGAVPDRMDTDAMHSQNNNSKHFKRLKKKQKGQENDTAEAETGELSTNDDLKRSLQARLFGEEELSGTYTDTDSTHIVLPQTTLLCITFTCTNGNSSMLAVKHKPISLLQ
jgi:hypothetical protein